MSRRQYLATRCKKLCESCNRQTTSQKIHALEMQAAIDKDQMAVMTPRRNLVRWVEVNDKSCVHANATLRKEFIGDPK